MFDLLKQNLERLGYGVHCFSTKEEATAYLTETVRGRTIGFGGSVSLSQMGLYEALSLHNEVYSHHTAKDRAESLAIREKAATAELYISSVNGMAMTGEILNIDGNGNRVASTFYGHDTVYLVVGKNKIAENYEAALWRARNIAGPLNAKRLGKKTPCVADGHCHDCQSPDRICCGLLVFWRKPMSCRVEILLVDEELGY